MRLSENILSSLAILIVLPAPLIKLLGNRIIILCTASAKQPTRAKIIGVPTLKRLYRYALVLPS